MLADEVVVLRYPVSGVDRYNNPARGTPTETTYPARVEQTSAQEITEGRSTLISDWVAYLPHDADVEGHDELVYDGATFEVVGMPNVQKTPRGPHHTEVRLRLVES